MKLRALTDEEKELVQVAKEQIKQYFKPLQEEARRRRKSRSSRQQAEEDLKALRRLPEAPVRLYDADTFEAVIVDYGVASKLIARIDDTRFMVSLKIVRDYLGAPSLQLVYQNWNDFAHKGQIELWGMPFDSQNALDQVALPAISI